MPYVEFEPKSAWRNCLVESMLAIYAAELGFTGTCAMLWFQGLSGGKTWHPPILVSAVGAGARVGAGVWCVAFRVDVALAARADADGELVVPSRWGTSPTRAPPPDGVGIGWAEGPLQAVRTSSDDTSNV